MQNHFSEEFNRFGLDLFDFYIESLELTRSVKNTKNLKAV